MRRQRVQGICGRFRKAKRRVIRLAVGALGIFCMVCLVYWLQYRFAHRTSCFVPMYPQVELTEGTDYETFFRQTGLGRAAIDKLLAAGELERIQQVQQAYFAPVQESCDPLLGWFTREDHRGIGPELVDLQPGDILLTLSTHSMGWRHGHAGLVIDADTTLECAVLGSVSCFGTPEYWRHYSGYCVLRVKGVTEELQKQAAEYASANLRGVPYHLSAGFVGGKAPEPDAPWFGLQCTYLVWYAWQHLGVDLDSDGGRLVTAGDLLDSGHLEVVQIYGMERKDP